MFGMMFCRGSRSRQVLAACISSDWIFRDFDPATRRRSPAASTTSGILGGDGFGVDGRSRLGRLHGRLRLGNRLDCELAIWDGVGRIGLAGAGMPRCGRRAVRGPFLTRSFRIST